jgi:hypothetical protein
MRQRPARSGTFLGEAIRPDIDHVALQRIYGDGEWLDQKHSIHSRRRWHKLHLGFNSDTHEIVAVELTADDVGHVVELPNLLDQVDADVASMTADGAYDGQVVYDAVAKRHPEASVIVPPRIAAVASETTASQRDNHLAVALVQIFCPPTCSGLA